MRKTRIRPAVELGDWDMDRVIGRCALLLGVVTLTCTTAVAAFASGPLETIPNGDSDCNAVVVWAHGLGDTNKGWSATMRLLQSRMPHVCFLLPTAPVIPITFADGRKLTAWYDFDGTEMKNASKEGDAQRIAESARYLQDIALRHVKSAGISSRPSFRRVVIGGFSQGAVVALHAGLTTSGSACAGVVAVAGYFAAGNAFAAKAARGLKKNKFHPATPVLLLHGEDDDRIPPGRSVGAKERLATFGVRTVELALYPKMGHGMNDAMLDRLAAFLRDVLPPDSDEL
jgi:lysophospholipase-1